MNYYLKVSYRGHIQELHIYKKKEVFRGRLADWMRDKFDNMGWATAQDLKNPTSPFTKKGYKVEIGMCEGWGLP